MKRARRTPAPATPAVRSTWWAPALIVLAGVITYANSLDGPFLFDDFGSIVRNLSIRDLSSWSVLAPPADGPMAGRPLVNLSFAINYAIGGEGVRGYHAVNIGLHLVCGLLVFGVVMRTLSIGLACAVALVWTVHPLNSEVVNYLTQRSESMMAACFLLTLYAASAQGASRKSWQVVAVGACAAGMACKETMAVAPVAVLLYDAVFAFGSAAAAIRARWRFYACLASTWVPLAVLVATSGQSFTAGFTFASASVWTYFINQPVMIAQYLRLSIWPHSLVLYYGWPPAVTLADVWPYVLSVTALFLAAVATLWRGPRIGAPAVWVFLTLGPTSSLIPIVTEVGAERRMYLPLIGVITLLVSGAAWAWGRLGTGRMRGRWVPAVALALVALAYGGTTRARNREYASALTMAETVLARWPTPNAHQLVGTELAAVGRHQDAIPHLRDAAAGYPMARYFLGEALLRAGQATEAIAALQAFLPDAPPITARNAHLLLSQAYSFIGQPARAIDELKTVMAIAPDDAATHALLADRLAEQQAFAEAIPHYRAFLRAHPGSTSALTGLGIALVATGTSAEAVTAFRSAVDAEPRNSRFRQNLARALLDQGETAEALRHAQEAVTLGPTDPASFDVLGRVLARLGRLADARLTFQRAIGLDPAYAPTIVALRAIGR